jgi:hypothetical protein
MSFCSTTSASARLDRAVLALALPKGLPMLELVRGVAARFWIVFLALAALANVAACTSGRMPRGSDAGGVGDGASAMCAPGVTQYCLGATSVACNSDGSEGARTDCALGGGVCAPGLGCRACLPDHGACDGNTVQRCRSDGSGYDTVTTCDPSTGQTCNAFTASCSSPCEDAAEQNSYIGCEYWPVPTLNNALLQQDAFTGETYFDFTFAIAIANPGTDAAEVTVTRGGRTVATRTIGGGALDTIELDWVNGLQPPPDTTSGITPSAFVANGAYQVTSTRPVTVYQFNPLDYETSGRTGTVNSFSNDASLLLPAHAMTGNYMVVSRPTHMIERTATNQDDPSDTATFANSSPGFFSLVGVDATPVSVDITFSANVVASGDGRVRAFRRGETGTFTLAQGDVLQVATGQPAACTHTPDHDSTTQVVPDPLFGDQTYDIDIYYCDVGTDYDLTGTEIRGTGRLELVSGHNCDFVPANRWACDHLEEGMFPLETWGDEAIVAVTRPLRGEPNVIRIISSHDGNAVAFDPPSAHAGVTLNRGDFIEFEASESFRVTGSDALLAAQFLVGQDYAGFNSSPMGAQGDPSMSLAIPTEQYRTSYTFLAPTSYASSFVTVTAPSDVPVLLDGSAVSGFGAVGATGFSSTTTELSGGVHTITSSSPFGIVVYGFGTYTSYMYPGGLDLEMIDAPF